MWTQGKQPVNEIDKINERLMKHDGYLEEDVARQELVRFLRSNIGFTCKIIAGLDLFPFQEIAIKSMFAKDYVLGIWCLDKESTVFTKNGIKKIKDVEIGDYIFSKNKANKVVDKWSNPLEGGKQITTKRGYTFRGKNGHQCLTLEKKSYKLVYKKIEDLRKGDYLALRYGSNTWGNYNPFKGFKFKKTGKKQWSQKICCPENTPDFYNILGLFLGDGWFNTKNKVFSISSGDASSLESIRDRLKKYAPNNTCSIRDRGGKPIEIYLCNKMFCEFLEHLGFEPGLKAHEKIIPDPILKVSKNKLCSLLRGLFDADGFCSVIKDNRRKDAVNCKLGLKSTSRAMLHQVRMILLNLGIVSSLRETTGNQQDRRSWNLVVSGHRNMQLFKKNIDFSISHKRQNLDTVLKRLGSNSKPYQALMLPEFGEFLKKNGIEKKHLGCNSNNISYSVLKNKKFPRNVKETVSQFDGIELLPVSLIEDIQTETIDITVENEECYVGDGFIHHNSRGSSKCLNVNDLVWTDNGLKKAIDVQVGDGVQSIRKINKVTGKTVNPKDTTYKVISKKGFVSEGLDHHRVLILNENLDFEWKFAGNLRCGEIAVMRKNCEFPCQGDIFKNFIQKRGVKLLNVNDASMKEWYYFFGLVLGDSHIARRSVTITSEDCEIKKFVESFARKIGLENKSYQKKESKTASLEIHSVGLVDLLLSLGFIPSKAYKKHIPQKLLQCSEENACSLLRGLMDTDGFASVKTKAQGKSKAVTVGFTSSSNSLIKQVGNLLLQLGIVSSTSLTSKGGKQKFGNKHYICRKAYSIKIYSQKNLRVFSDKINFNIKRKSVLLHAVNDYKYQNEEFSEFVPLVGDYLKLEYEKKGFSCSKEKYQIAFRKQTSKRLLKKILKTKRLKPADQKKIEVLSDPNLFFDEIKRVELSEAETVDLQVENEHCYVSDGFINHNSWTTGVFAFLYAIFEPEAKIAIISRSFRQSREIFKKIEEIMIKPEGQLLAECLGSRPKHLADEWSMKIGKSEIKALPLGDGEKLRGFRFNCLIVDELLLMPDRVMNEIIMPFLSTHKDPKRLYDIRQAENSLIEKGEMKEGERYQFKKNKMIGLSSASYKFEPLYKTYQDYIKKIVSGTEDGRELNEDKSNQVKGSYAVLQFSYDYAKLRCEGLYDEALVEKAKSEMSPQQYEREFGAQFSNESGGFFNMLAMNTCSVPYGEYPTTEIKGEDGAKYILAIDPAWAENDSSDFFAMTLIKVLENGRYRLVNCYAVAGGKFKDHAEYLRYILSNFNVVFVMIDNAGGPTFLQFVNQYKWFKSRPLEAIPREEADFSDIVDYQRQLQKAKGLYNREINKIVYFQHFNSDWIRRANELLQGNIGHKRIVFASPAQGIETEYKKQRDQTKIDNLKDLKFIGSVVNDKKNKLDEAEEINKTIDQLDEGLSQDKRLQAKQIDLLERQGFLLELTKTQCALIQIKASDSGVQTFTLPHHLKNQTGPNKTRRDLYTSLLIANWASKCYHDMIAAPQEEEFDFMPSVIRD